VGVIKRQGIKNVFITYIGVIIGAVSAIFIQPVLLSSTEFGFTRNLYNFSFLLSIALPIGLPNIILRFYPQYKQEEYIKKHFFGFILTYFFISSLFILLIFFLFREPIMSVYRSDSELFIAYFLCVIPYSLIIAFNSTITSFSQSVYKSTVPSFLNDVVSRILVILITLLYFYKLINFDLYVLFSVLIYLLMSIVLVMYLVQFGLVSFRISLPVLKKIDLKRMITYGLMMCVISFTSFGLRSIDSIFLGIYSLSNVAVYSIAVFLALFIEVPLSAIERISHSKISESFALGNYTEIGKIYSESVKYLLVFGGFIFLGITACSEYVFEFLPAEYSSGVYLVPILSFGCLVNVSTGVNNAILFYTNKFRQGGVLLLVVFIITVILDILFIPAYGMFAAAIITASVSILFNVSKFIFIYRAFKFQPYDLNSLKIFIIIASGFGFIQLLPAFTGWPLVNILINGTMVSVFYLTLIYKLNIIPEVAATIKARLPFGKNRS
jgi:O-antigen/teichoic acid export membrane protein